METSAISFFQKQTITCPVCHTDFHREELRTGGGRLIAGDLSSDLRRHYEPSQKFGEIYPLIYPVTVCPQCFYAAFPQDFEAPKGPFLEALQEDSEARSQALLPLFGVVDFREPRDLFQGAGGYILAMQCYDHQKADLAPTIKQGISALRTAWICQDLHRREPNENWDYLGRLFYRKARFFYVQAIEAEGDGQESIAEARNLGPDLDKNYGYDGVLYLAAYLELQYGPGEDKEKRKANLEAAKRTVGRIFGMGKASKDKPAVLLDRAKELRSSITEALKALDTGETPEPGLV